MSHSHSHAQSRSQCAHAKQFWIDCIMARSSIGFRTRPFQGRKMGSTPIRVAGVVGAVRISDVSGHAYFGNSSCLFCAHDVAVACCLAMAEVRVRLPLGALFVCRIRGGDRCTGDCGGACVGTGRRLLSAQSQVRFLPPQLGDDASVMMRWSRGPAATTSGLHPENDGSIPSGTTA